MPTYEYQCPDGHEFEIFVQTVSARPVSPPCPCTVGTRYRPDLCPGAFSHGYDAAATCERCPEEPEPCELPAKQVFRTPAQAWIPGVNKETVFDYPGSKVHKAGYVHGYVDPGVKKVSAGAGGVLNPSTRDRHPLAKVVQPDWKAPKE